jgi:hypothetical protein
MSAERGVFAAEQFGQSDATFWSLTLRRAVPKLRWNVLELPWIDQGGAKWLAKLFALAVRSSRVEYYVN